MSQKLIYGTNGIPGLSHSKLQDLYCCPRKFQLKHILNSVGESESDENIHFAFGHAVGAGVQQLFLEPNNLRKAVLSCFSRWDLDIELTDNKRKKSVWYAIRAVQSFHKILSSNSTLARKYEIAYFTDKKTGNRRPCIELFFKITLPDGFVYEGHIDLILREKGTDNYVVLELKTSSFSLMHDATFKNSPQAVGYTLVLDLLFPFAAQYVFYLIYKTGKMEFEEKVFPKGIKQKLNFVSGLLSDIDLLKKYEADDYFPMRGNSCYEFFTPCEYFGVCEMSNEVLKRDVSRHASENENKVEYDFEFNLLEEFDKLMERADV